MQRRTIKKDGVHSMRVCRFSNEMEYNEETAKVKAFFRNSVKVLYCGNFDTKHQSLIKNMSYDDAYLELGLRLGDYFMLTDEDINQLAIDEKRYEQLINPTQKLPMEKKKNDFFWSEEQKQLLWSDTVENLMVLFNRTKNAINSARYKYLQENPSFVPPVQYVQLKGKRGRQPGSKNTKAPKDKKNKVPVRQINIPSGYREWTKEELDGMWEGNLDMIAEKYRRTPGAVYFQRNQFLKKNPNFIVPDSAKLPKTEKVIFNVVETFVENPIPEVKELIIAVPTAKATSVPEIAELKGFKISVNGKEMIFDAQPKKLTVGDIQIEF